MDLTNTLTTSHFLKKLEDFFDFAKLFVSILSRDILARVMTVKL